MKSVVKNILDETIDDKQKISPELGALLGLSVEELDEEHGALIEERLASMIVDALVRYGKDRGHLLKVSRISTLLCHAIGIRGRYRALLENASLIYDIGNLSIDASLYKKDTQLSFEEFETLKHHTRIGQEILLTQNHPMTDMAAVISVQHHEWFDGSGYPHGLSGDNIVMASRIVAVADTVAALSSPRYGRQAIGFDDIIEHVEKRRGLQFDPEVVHRFLEHSGEIRAILDEREVA